MQEHVLLLKAIRHLEIDVPVLAYEIVKQGVIRLALYGGKVVEYNGVEYNSNRSPNLGDEYIAPVGRAKRSVKHGN